MGLGTIMVRPESTLSLGLSNGVFLAVARALSIILYKLNLTMSAQLTSGATFALYKPMNPPVIHTPANFLVSWVADKCNIVFCVPAFIEVCRGLPHRAPSLVLRSCVACAGMGARP